MITFQQQNEHFQNVKVTEKKNKQELENSIKIFTGINNYNKLAGISMCLFALHGTLEDKNGQSNFETEGLNFLSGGNKVVN